MVNFAAAHRTDFIRMIYYMSGKLDWTWLTHTIRYRAIKKLCF